MSLFSRKSLLDRIRRSKESREKLVSSNLDKGIAYQIRATRDEREMSQSQLALKAGMAQNNISRLESPDYGKHTISSLKRLADAFDVALVVRFVPFSQYIDWLSGTDFLDKGIRPESLAVPSFDDEDSSGQYETVIKYFGLYEPSKVTAFANVASGILTPRLEPQMPSLVPPVRGVSMGQTDMAAIIIRELEVA
jgi:transcriptional regulator with XRE-family HTH domain